jgi:hypothetical protein
MKYIILIFVFLHSTATISQTIELLTEINLENFQSLNVTEKNAISAQFNKSLLISEQKFLTIQLSNFQTITIQKAKLKQKSINNYSWFGHIKGQPEHTVNFAVVNDSISGSIFTELGIFEIVALGNNQIKLIQLITENFEQCQGTLEAPNISINNFNKHSNNKSPSGTIETTLDVLIFYSKDTLTALGSHESVESTAQASINNMNTALANSQLMSGIDEIRLLAVLALDRVESGSASTELNWLSSDSTVTSLRNLYGADLVSMLSATTGGCGIGYVMRSPGPGFSESAFQVTKYTCAVGNLTMAHEFGHNLGLEHNPENSNAWPNSGSYPYSFAHYHNGSYRTVMSYSNPCANGCSRRMYFSNPDVDYLDLPTGIDETNDNTRSLEQTTLFAVDFRMFTNEFLFSNSFE